MSVVRQVIPQPLVSLAIILLWLVLVGTLSYGQVLIALLLALFVPLFTSRFWPDQPKMGHPFTAMMLFGRVLYDIVVANIDVARRVLGPIPVLRPAWAEVPLDTDDFFVATLVGSIITLTPGTLTCDVDREKRMLLVHFLHVEDVDASISEIKERYEAPLKKVFKC